MTSAIQGDHYDHKKLEEENRVRSTSTLPHGKLITERAAFLTVKLLMVHGAEMTVAQAY